MKLSIMKIQYKLGLMAVGLLALSSCEKHDLVADNMAIGQRVPTVYWTVGSTACKAGEEFSFEGKYYTEDGHQPSHSEVWYSIIREDVMSAQVKLVSSLAFTQQTTVTDTIRTSQHIKSFPHSLAVYNGHEYVINGTVPTSSTLSPVQWQNKSSVWDDAVQKQFDVYFPEGFEEGFVADAKSKTMASESVLRDVYCTYTGFTPEVVGEINNTHGTTLPTDFSDEEGGMTKAQLWYRITDSNTDAEKKDAIVGYYYRNDAGNDVSVATEEVGDSLGNKYILLNGNLTFCYPVYDASHWLYCRYDNDAGSIVTTVLPEYTAAFEALVDMITFPEWIKGSAADGYVATFKRTHKLSTDFKVVDTEGNVGKYSTPYEITLN